MNKLFININMGTLNEKDFEKALGNDQITGKYISRELWVLDYTFEKYTFKDMELIKGSLTCSIFKNCEFTNATFESVHLDECEFKNCEFTNTLFKKCSTNGTKFENCISAPTIT
jgi:uncharacterized protein YjbI with pentapeptide repeats